VEFFGQKARMMGGPAALAVQTGAALMPAVLWYEDRGWGVHIYPEVPVPAEGSRRDKIAAMTQQMARSFEAGIAAHPEDWHMLQRVFAEDFGPGRLPAPAGPAEELNAGVSGDGAGGGGPS
jgi:phosphatidylinositol dimannoside acyltransferase